MPFAVNLPLLLSASSLVPVPVADMPVAHGYFELTRLHKPLMGNTLMFWPCGKSPSRQGQTRINDPPRLAWGLTIAARATSLPLVVFAEKLVWFALGSMLLHSAACVLNDICDVDFDRQVGTSPSLRALVCRLLTSSCRT